MINGLKGFVISHRRGLTTQNKREYLLRFPGFNSDGKAHQLIGRKVAWRSPVGKELRGLIITTHGKNGVVLARFQKGLPGFALGSEVKIIS